MGEVQSRLLRSSGVPEYTSDRVLRNLQETVFQSPVSVDVSKSLVKASASGDKDMVQKLLRDHMADVDGVYSRKTALQQASYYGHTEVIEVLLKYHVDVEKSEADGDRAVHQAAYGDRPDVIKLLHESVADLNARNNQMYTPLHIGINKNHIRVVRTLINLGCNLNLKDSEGKTPLHVTIRKEQLNMVYLLLKHGADVTIADNNGLYPLFLAASFGHVGIVSLLVTKLNKERSRNVDVATKEDGTTALHNAARLDHVEVVEVLIDEGKANRNQQNCRLETPLHLAVFGGHTQIVELLVGKGCKVNLQDENGDTPLHYAVRQYGMIKHKSLDFESQIAMRFVQQTHRNLRSTISFVRLLRANGADIEIKNSAGHTPLDLPCGHDLLSERF